MNWMLIIVIIIFLVALIRGWRRGLLRLLFSLVSIVVLIWLFSTLNPYISTFLEEHTGIYDRIELWCEGLFEERLGTGLAFLTDSAASVAADWIFKGACFLITLIVALIIVWIIFRVLKLVNRIPVLGRVNQVLGLVGGAVEGYIVICLVFLFISLIAGTEVGTTLTENIESNAFLTFLYDSDFLFTLNLIQ